MKQLKIQVEPRENIGRGAARRLRKSGEVPAIIYGKSGSRALSIKEVNFRNLMRNIAGSVALIEVDNPKEGYKVLSVLQEIQRHPIRDTFIHVDFREVCSDEAMTTNVPVHIKSDDCVGIKTGNGILETVLHEIEVKCLPKNLPEYIEVDTKDLHAGFAIHVRDLPPLPGVSYLNEPDCIVVSCNKPIKTQSEGNASNTVEAQSDKKV